MKIHFIAIGGAVMHNLAIALHLKGYTITGSDDEIFDPSKSRLKKYGILPKEWGWFEDNISANLDAVILGMHARPDNPELKRALDLKLKIYSFPEYLYKQTKNKKRVVIAGSHGKTTITSMIMHVLKEQNIQFDYMVGSQLEGFETMVGLNEDAKIAIFEGDEYLSSPLDSRPKFIHYKPDITLISGIAWDHMNVYPDYEDYKKQFYNLGLDTNPDSKVFICKTDIELEKMSADWEEIRSAGKELAVIEAYSALEYKIKDGLTEINHENNKFRLKLIGRYNIENLSGAMQVCNCLGIANEAFLSSMIRFKGAARRQELIFESENISIFRDFAHAPSKVKATTAGFKEQFPNQKLTVFLELHTFSSLNKEFLPLYKNALYGADEAYIYFNPDVVRHKKLPDLDKDYIKKCFNQKEINVINNSSELEIKFKQSIENTGVLLLMSSGNFGEISIMDLINPK
ncbi:MAG: peptidoglycan synthetase [Bacteroidales bacterium]|nr:peptidoglycan synthetase [Bacteroidales bacterium]